MYTLQIHVIFRVLHLQSHTEAQEKFTILQSTRSDIFHQQTFPTQRIDPILHSVIASL